VHVKPRIADVATAFLLLSGCGEEVEPVDRATEHHEPVEGDEPITPRAVAAVALDHVPTETSSRTDASGGGAVGVEFRYGANGEYDGDMLSVGVTTPPLPEGLCKGMDRCEREDVEGGELVVAWDELEPEEDPGVVTVAMTRDDGEVVAVFFSGDNIEGDPRDQDLSIPVAEMEAVVRDQRISLTTSAEVIELGERLEVFGE
jgi:hypothetical protein